MNNTTIQSLQTLGLSEKEARVYLALLGMKKGGALAIAKQAGVKRPTAYHVLETLKTKKLVSSTLYRGVKDYRALPVDSLKAYVKRQNASAKKFLPAMKKMYDKREQKLRLRVYNNVSSVKTLLEKSLREKATVYLLGDEKIFSEYIGNYWQFYLKRSKQLGVSPKWKKKAGNTALMVWNDKVAFGELGENIQLFAFRNKELNSLYQKLWNNY